ncbi:MAG: hypothetical protein HYS18_02110 [Burkholderiales bacterium]|nr:hypothetical protein [Burkholderiales bacterium]
MLLFLDTEFTGINQAKPDLISIALVNEDGREFYAELPEEHWTVQCNEWVHFNVVRHLWRGEYVQSEVVTREKLTAWINELPEMAVIVTDCPDADFFGQLKRLLTPWPANLDAWPIQFTTWSMGDDWQPALQKVMDGYFGPARPKHHALHDAHALRHCYAHATANGWKPVLAENS